MSLICSFTSAAFAQDTMSSTDAPWRCYTGREDTGNGNHYVMIGYKMYLNTPESRMPEITDDAGKRLSTVRWTTLPADIHVSGEHVGTCRGKEIWRYLYRSNQTDQSVDHVDAVVFTMTLSGGLARPFFVLFPSGTELFESFFDSSPNIAFSLHADTHESGTGAFHSSYAFSFLKGIPRFLGRTDSGRRHESKTYR